MELQVNDLWIRLVHRAVARYLETWPGGDPQEQEIYRLLKTDLDRLLLEVAYND